MSDELRIVQFLHPGGEHRSDENGRKPWNQKKHRRTFVRQPGLSNSLVNRPGWFTASWSQRTEFAVGPPQKRRHSCGSQPRKSGESFSPDRPPSSAGQSQLSTVLCRPGNVAHRYLDVAPRDQLACLSLEWRR